MAPKALSDFEGYWRLSRVIDDLRAGTVGQMEGQAVFAPVEGGLRCEETGRLSYGEAEMEARRVYLWRAVPGGIAVDFEDGRAFHSFPMTARAQAEHLCTPDLYRVTYDFSGWPDWHAEWRVTGPRKEYSSRTAYRRL